MLINYFRDFYMSKVFVVLTALIMLFSLAVNAQQQQLQQPQIQNIKPVVTAGDLVFAAQLLNSVELRGNEVDAFISVKNTLKPFLEKVQNEKMQATQTLDIPMTLAIANNFLGFLERGKITGADAERYKRFIDAFIEAAKALQSDKK
jgi:hypothetical protein